MDIYDMMKGGMSQEEIFAEFKKQSKIAREKLQAEKRAAAKAEELRKKAEVQAQEAKAKKEALIGEGRTHMINAILAYSEAYGIITADQINEEYAKSIEQEVIQMEAMLEKSLILMDKLKGGDKDLDFGDLFKFWF